MTPDKKNLAILEKFEFGLPPVGVKFLPQPPDMVPRLDENLALCEMLKRAQEGKAFFADAQNHTCEAGMYVLGQADAPEPFISGQFGAGLQIYEAPRSASRLYHAKSSAGSFSLHNNIQSMSSGLNPSRGTEFIGKSAYRWEYRWSGSGTFP